MTGIQALACIRINTGPRSAPEYCPTAAHEPVVPRPGHGAGIQTPSHFPVDTLQTITLQTSTPA